MIDRRTFLKSAGAATAAAALGTIASPMNANAAAPASAASRRRVVGANGKVNVALIGIGHRGAEDEAKFAATNLMNVVALCDVDMGAPHTQKVMAKYPGAKRYQDFRKMFDEMSKQIDAVVVATPDFSHFPICMRAIKEGISVYSEKPMCRTFYETELLIQAAKMHPEVVTQMGNQGHSEGNYFQFKAWQDAGLIKDVTKITAHMNSSRRWHGYDVNNEGRMFPHGETAPETIDWDVWQMQTLYHDYSDKFHEGNWRCWYDFGMGALGDWGAHILDTCHQFLDLGLPYSVEMLYANGHNDYYFPYSSTILFRFPRRGNMPACDITWYDGVDNIPEVPAGYKFSSKVADDIPTVNGGALKPSKLNPGKEIYARDYIFQGGSHAATLSIIPEELQKQLESEGKLPEVPKTTSDHFANFLLAVKGKEQTRSPFEIAGPLCQVFNLGVIAQRLNTKFTFDRNTKEIIDNPFANSLLACPPRKGWEDYYVL